MIDQDSPKLYDSARQLPPQQCYGFRTRWLHLIDSTGNTHSRTPLITQMVYPDPELILSETIILSRHQLAHQSQNTFQDQPTLVGP
jgi:hypothetical protein